VYTKYKLNLCQHDQATIIYSTSRNHQAVSSSNSLSSVFSSYLSAHPSNHAHFISVWFASCFTFISHVSVP